VKVSVILNETDGWDFLEAFSKNKSRDEGWVSAKQLRPPNSSGHGLSYNLNIFSAKPEEDFRISLLRSYPDIPGPAEQRLTDTGKPSCANWWVAISFMQTQRVPLWQRCGTMEVE
jgi:hypothetical protein